MPTKKNKEPSWRWSQTALFDWVTSDRPATELSHRTASAVIKPGGRLKPVERIEIYRQMFWARTLDSLAEDFPGVQALLGSDAFERACRTYITQQGSRSYTLRDLGRGLPLHLARTLRPARPDACAVARYEWAQIEAFDQAAFPSASTSDLNNQPPHRLRIGVQPYVQLLTVAYPVGEYVSSLKTDGVLRGDASQAFLTRRNHGSRQADRLRVEPRYTLAVHRWENRLYFKRLSRTEAILLRRLRSGHTLAQACQTLSFPTSLTPSEAASQLGEWFRVWAGLGWLHFQQG